MLSMTKVIKTIEDFPQGYSTMDTPRESFVWEQMQQMLPKNGRYLKHFVEQEWTRNDTQATYTPKDMDPNDLKIPLGTLSFILIIFYEPWQ